MNHDNLANHKVVSGSEDEIDTDPQDADQRKSVLTNVAGYIIVTEFCERLAYYGFAGSLVLFLQVLTIEEITVVAAKDSLSCNLTEAVQLHEC